MLVHKGEYVVLPENVLLQAKESVFQDIPIYKSKEDAIDAVNTAMNKDGMYRFGKDWFTKKDVILRGNHDYSIKLVEVLRFRYASEDSIYDAVYEQYWDDLKHDDWLDLPPEEGNILNSLIDETINNFLIETGCLDKACYAYGKSEILVLGGDSVGHCEAI